MSKHICCECGNGYYCKCGRPCGYENSQNYCLKCRMKPD